MLKYLVQDIDDTDLRTNGSELVEISMVINQEIDRKKTRSQSKSIEELDDLDITIYINRRVIFSEYTPKKTSA